MHVSVFSHLANAGWSAPLDPALDSEHTLVIAFGASGLLDAPGPVHDVFAAYPKARVIGCSTSGEVHGTRIHDDSLVVAVTRFDSVGLRAASAPVASAADSFTAGESIARQLQADDLRAVLVFSDGLLVNGSELVRGLNGVLPPEVVVTHRHLSDDTVAGLRHRRLPIFSLQHHPEASPGPHDARHAFQRFVRMMEEHHA